MPAWSLMQPLADNGSRWLPGSLGGSGGRAREPSPTHRCPHMIRYGLAGDAWRRRIRPACGAWSHRCLPLRSLARAASCSWGENVVEGGKDFERLIH